MKTTLTPMATRWTTSRTLNCHISEALQRKRHQADYQTEMALIGTRLRTLRVERGYALHAVARALKMPKRRLYQIECGTYLHFGLRELHGLSDYYGLSPVEVLTVIPHARFDKLKF